MKRKFTLFVKGLRLLFIKRTVITDIKESDKLKPIDTFWIPILKNSQKRNSV